MKKIDYSELNRKLDIFIYDGYPVFEDDFLFEERLCNIILENLYPINRSKKREHGILFDAKRKMSQDKMIQYSLEFLKEIDPDYSKLLNQVLEEKRIIIEPLKDIYDTSFMNSKKNLIYLKTSQNISDALTMAHELMHYVNMRNEISNPVASYYTESFSFLTELLMIDYIKKQHHNYYKDVLSSKRNNFIALYEDNVCLKIILELMKRKIAGKEINTYEMFEIVKLLDAYSISFPLIDADLEEVIDSILDEDDFSCEDNYLIHARNTVGTILSCYMYEMIKNKKDEQEIFDLNNCLNIFSVYDVLRYLNLEFKPDTIFDLTEDSYKNLEHSYQKVLKSLWK